jgi:modulator of FtsH protease HflK
LLKASLTAAVLLVAGALVAAYAWLGYVQIVPGEEAIVLRLGRYHRTLREGPNWYLPFVDTLERERVTNRRLEFGYRTRGERPSPVEKPEGEAAPLEYEDDPGNRRMITQDENLVDVEFVLEYRITDLRAYLLNVESAADVLSDVARASLREAVAQRSIDEVLGQGRAAIQSEAERRIEEVLSSYGEAPGGSVEGSTPIGVSVVSLRLQDVYPPEAARDAFRDVTGAQQDKQRLQVEAEGYRDEVVPRARGDARRTVAEAEGYRDAKILEAEGEATRFSALLVEYRKAPEVTRTRLHIETLEAVLPKMEKIILRDGTGDRVLPYLPLGRRAAPPGER